MSGWLGGDPDGMRGDAARLTGAADDLAALRASLFAAAGVSDVAAAVAGELAEVQEWCDGAAGALTGAAAALEAVDARAMAGLAALTGATLHPGTPAAASTPPSDASPAGVAAWWAGLGPAARDGLEAVAGDRLAGLAGIPADVRDRLNRAAVEAEAGRVEAELRRADAALVVAPPGSSWARRLEVERATLDARLAGTDALLGPDVTVLAFDPAGDGRYTAVVGDPAAAGHVAVLSPGVGTTLGSAHLHLQEAAFARDRAFRGGGADLAVAAWLGYDAPEWADAGSFAAGARAEAGAPHLGETVDDLAAVRAAAGAPPAHTTVVGHSYGAVVAGTAARDGLLDVDELVLVGAAGSAVARASDYRLPDDARVWAATTADDPIAAVYATDDLVAFADRLPFVDVEHTGPDGQPHGADPSSPGFGATPFDVSDISGHGAYLAAGTQAHVNLVDILTGRSREPEPER